MPEPRSQPSSPSVHPLTPLGPQPGAGERAAGGDAGGAAEPDFTLTPRIAPARGLPLEISLLLSRRPACRLVIGRSELHEGVAPDGETEDNTLALLRLHLRAELPELRFWRRGDAEPEIVWLCAFTKGSEGLVAALRHQHPQAFLMVSARNPGSAVQQGLKLLGADAVYGIRDLRGMRLRELLRAGLAFKRGILQS